MECSCSISAGLTDSSTVLSKKWRNAIKPHVCYECGRDILVGEKYYIEKILEDGQFDTFKTCSDCKSISENLVADFYWGQVREMVAAAIYDCDGQLPEKCIAKLTPLARAWVCSLIEETWEDTNARHKKTTQMGAKDHC